MMMIALWWRYGREVGCSSDDDGIVVGVVVVVCLPRTYGRNGVIPIFRSFHRTASSTTGGWSPWNI